MSRIPRGTGLNIQVDTNLKVSNLFELPIKNTFTDDLAGSIALKPNNLLSYKDNTGAIRELISGDLSLYALLDSPIFIGSPKANTAAPGTNTTQLATTAFVQSALANSGTGTVTNVSSFNNDILVANGSTTPTLTLNSGNGANQIVKRDGSGNISATLFNGTATTANTATSWGNLGTSDNTATGTAPSFLLGNVGGVWKPITNTGLQSFVGLDNYLAKSGGNMSGDINFNDLSSNKGLAWFKNTDFAKIYFESTDDFIGDSNLVFESGDNIEPTPGGLTEGFIFRKNASGDTPPSVTELARINLTQFKYLSNDVIHAGSIGSGLNYNTTTKILSATGGSSGTVTSVNMTVPTGFTVSGNPITTSGTLAVSLQSGYSIPTTANQTTWSAKQNAISLTTTGTSGAATFDGTTLNIPNYVTDISGKANLAGGNNFTGNQSINGQLKLVTQPTNQIFEGHVLIRDLTTGDVSRMGLSGTPVQGDLIQYNGSNLAYVNKTFIIPQMQNVLGNGNGSSTTISVPHGIAGVTSSTAVMVGARNAASAGISYWTIDATNVNIFYTVAPASGTGNLLYTIQVRPS